jgi:hypothetical protein
MRKEYDGRMENRSQENSGSVLICFFGAYLLLTIGVAWRLPKIFSVGVGPVPLITDRYFISFVDPLARIERTHSEASWISAAENEHTLRLMMYRRVQGGLIVETNKQFQPKTRHPFVVGLFEGTIFDRIIHDLFSDEHRVSINDDLAREYQFAVIKGTVYRLFQLSRDTIPDLDGIVDGGDYRLKPCLQMLGNGVSNISELVSKKYNGFTRIFEGQIRGEGYGIDANPWTISEVQLPLRKTRLFDRLSSQSLGMCSGECQQSTLSRGLCNQFPGLPSRLLHLCNLITHSFVLPKHYMPLPSHLMPRTAHLAGLTGIYPQGEEHYDQLQYAYASQHPCKPRQFPLSGPVFIGCLLVVCSSMAGSCCAASLAFRPNGRLRRDSRGLCGWTLLALSGFAMGCALSTIGFGSPFAFWRFRWLLDDENYCKNHPFHKGQIVSQKHLTTFCFCNTFSGMANVLRKKAKIGRPKLPKGEAKGKIVPVRFALDDLKAIAARAKAADQNVSEWIRSTIHASL